MKPRIIDVHHYLSYYQFEILCCSVSVAFLSLYVYVETIVSRKKVLTS